MLLHFIRIYKSKLNWGVGEKSFSEITNGLQLFFEIAQRLVIIIPGVWSQT